MATVLRSLASGAVVYVLAAACAASERSGELGGGDAGVLDGIVDPVPSARASEVAEEPCSVLVPIPNSNGSIRYAVHRYPGKTAAELSAVRILLRPTKPSSIGGEEYSFVSGVSAAVRDGAVAAYCDTTSQANYEAAVFVLP